MQPLSRGASEHLKPGQEARSFYFMMMMIIIINIRMIMMSTIIIVIILSMFIFFFVCYQNITVICKRFLVTVYF